MFALVALLATLHLTAKANNHLFTVEPQTPIVVTLVSNPSTGYRWKYESSAGGGRVVKLLSHRYIAPRNAKPGAAGKEVWRLRAVGKGAMDMGFLEFPPGSSMRPDRKIGIAIRVR